MAATPRLVAYLSAAQPPAPARSPVHTASRPPRPRRDVPACPAPTRPERRPALRRERPLSAGGQSAAASRLLPPAPYRRRALRCAPSVISPPHLRQSRVPQRDAVTIPGNKKEHHAFFFFKYTLISHQPHPRIFFSRADHARSPERGCRSHSSRSRSAEAPPGAALTSRQRSRAETGNSRL